MFINYSDIAGHQNLFLDYVYEFENVEDFYLKNFRDFSNYTDIFQSLTYKPKGIRAELVSILKEQYSHEKTSHLTENNINLLNNSNTIAIVTGQQLGICGGPLYTLYKIITAIKLCSSLKSKFEGYNFVPVFWLEADDHDFNEINNFTIIDTNNQLKKFIYNDHIEEDINRGSVGNLNFNDEITNVILDFISSIKETDYTKGIHNLLKKSYKENNNIKLAFRELLKDMFDEYGLVIFDPQQKKVKELLIDIFLNEIENYRDYTSIAVQRSADLEELYHAQVKVKPINLFFSDSTGRHLIEPDENLFKLKNKKRKFTKEELIELIKSTPESFSPNVILRPICQDFLLPTGVYIAGPGEINYFAQVIPFYEIYNVVQPILYPRASVTILEKHISTLISKYDLNINNFFNVDNKLLQNIINSISEFNIQEIFAKTADEINQSMSQLNSPVASIDKTLLDLIEKSKEKFEQQLMYINQKVNKAQEQKHEVILRQLEKVKNSIFPNNSLQERTINYFYFSNKYGMNFYKWLINEIAIDKFEHQIIEL